MNLHTTKSRVLAAGCACGLSVALGLPSSVVAAQSPPTTAGKKPTVAPTSVRSPQGSLPPPRTSAGILSMEVSPDSISSIRTAQGVITRVALPDEAKEAVCGDLFDAATNTGSFIISRSGKDVFIKPVTTKGQSNLFIKTDATVYNFDLIIVPTAQAYRVVNVNQPSYKDRVEAERQKMLAEVDAQRRQSEAAAQQAFDARRQELEQQAAADLETERKKVRAEADRRAGELATRRLADGIMQGFTSEPVVERRGKFEQVTVELGASGYTFEGKLYVPYRITNASSDDLVYKEPTIGVRTPGQEGGDKKVQSATYTSQGEYRVAAGDSAQGVVVFERPPLPGGERLMFTLRAEGKGNRFVQLRIL